MRLPSTERNGSDPIRFFTEADTCGDEIFWTDCLATAYRMRDLVETFLCIASSEKPVDSCREL